MKLINYFWLIASIALLSACSGTAEKPRPMLDDVAPEILQVLPSDIDGFRYRGATTFPGHWGYSLRYRHDENPEVHADVFVHPLARDARTYTHMERVDLMSMRALRDLQAAQAQGAYSEYRIIHSGSFEIEGSYATRTDINLVKEKLPSFVLLFLTEREGKLLKLRMTMPDNYTNRHNHNWQQFAETVFGFILLNIDKA